MRSIKNYLNESIENEDYLNESILDADKPASLRAAKKEIREWILANCKLRNGSKRIDVSDDLVVDCDCSIQFRNANTKSLTNGKFKWGYVRSFFCGWTQISSLEDSPRKCEVFNCEHCPLLTSLEGAPEEVTGRFECSGCNRLTTLKGAPKEVGSFICKYCQALKNLDGSPEVVNGWFDCSECHGLQNFKGAPRVIDGRVRCKWCEGLKNFIGLPEKIGEWIECSGCDKLSITDDDRKKYNIHDFD